MQIVYRITSYQCVWVTDESRTQQRSPSFNHQSSLAHEAASRSQRGSVQTQSRRGAPVQTVRSSTTTSCRDASHVKSTLVSSSQASLRNTALTMSDMDINWSIPKLCKYELRKQFFVNRVAKLWNTLPGEWYQLAVY